MITLGATAGGIAFSMGGSKAAKAQGPPTNASSNDEEKFIQLVDHYSFLLTELDH